MTADFIIEAQAVVAQRAGPRHAHLVIDAPGELGLGNAATLGLLRGDAGDQTRHRLGQEVIGRLAIEGQRLADLIEVSIGTDGRELRRTVTARVGAEGLVVVPQEGGLCHRMSPRGRSKNERARAPSPARLARCSGRQWAWAGPGRRRRCPFGNASGGKHPTPRELRPRRGAAE